MSIRTVLMIVSERVSFSCSSWGFKEKKTFVLEKGIDKNDEGERIQEMKDDSKNQSRFYSVVACP